MFHCRVPNSLNFNCIRRLIGEGLELTLVFACIEEEYRLFLLFTSLHLLEFPLRFLCRCFLYSRIFRNNLLDFFLFLGPLEHKCAIQEREGLFSGCQNHSGLIRLLFREHLAFHQLKPKLLHDLRNLSEGREILALLGFEGFQKNLNWHSETLRPLHLIILLLLELATDIRAIREDMVPLAEKQRLHSLSIQTSSKEGILASIRYVLCKHTEDLFGLTSLVNCELTCDSVKLLEAFELFQIPCAWLFVSLQNLDLLIVGLPNGLGDIALDEEVCRVMISRMLTLFINHTSTCSIL